MTRRGRHRAAVAVGASLAWLAVAAAPGGGDPFTVRVACDNGTEHTATIDGDQGTVTVSSLPAGTRCTAEEVGGTPGAARRLEPVPGGGQVAVVFSRRSVAPVLAVRPPIGSPGETTRALGAGFPPGAPVRLTWTTGFSDGATVVADGQGRFATTLLVLRGDALGPRRLSAATAGVDPVEADYLVVAHTMVPGGPDARPNFRP